jgi:hypothetical protein
MASQSELILQIDLLKAQLVDYNAQLAVYRTQGDIAAIIETQTLISITENDLAEAEADLANLTVTTNPDLPNEATTSEEINQINENAADDPAISARQQALIDENNISPQTEIDPNSDPNLNSNEGAVDGTAEEIQRQKQAEADARQDDEAYQAALQQYVESEPPSSGGGAQGALNKTRSTATNQDAVSFEKAKDWRVRLSLAPNAKYLYNAGDPGILKPLTSTNGVIFPYTPNVSVVYAANYDASELVHSNYKIYNYKNSAVDTVSITCDFTAQDTNEANYLLAVIHFFRSVTKMFYGRDENPRNGTPPPLCYLSGLGTFQFDNHPLVVSNFTYTLPTDVDYIRVGSQTNMPGQSVAQQTFPVNTQDSSSLSRILSSGLGARTPNFQRQASTINSDATYVPTKMQIAITCIPIVTRNDISNNFSLKKYATGELLQGSKRNGGGIW